MPYIALYRCPDETLPNGYMNFHIWKFYRCPDETLPDGFSPASLIPRGRGVCNLFTKNVILQHKKSWTKGMERILFCKKMYKPCTPVNLFIKSRV